MYFHFKQLGWPKRLRQLLWPPHPKACKPALGFPCSLGEQKLFVPLSSAFLPKGFPQHWKPTMKQSGKCHGFNAPRVTSSKEDNSQQINISASPSFSGRILKCSTEFLKKILAGLRPVAYSNYPCLKCILLGFFFLLFSLFISLWLPGTTYQIDYLHQILHYRVCF